MAFAICRAVKPRPYMSRSSSIWSAVHCFDFWAAAEGMRSRQHFMATEDGAVKRACFCTTPSIPCVPSNFLAEFVGTFVLVFAIKGIAQTGDLPDGVNNFFVFGIITSIGMSLGGLTGYAINPARDLGPRLMYALLPLGKKDSANWGYAWIPVVAPLFGALAAVGLYKVFPWPTP